MTTSTGGKSTKNLQQTDDTTLLTVITSLTQGMEEVKAQNTNLTCSVEELKAQNEQVLQSNKELQKEIRKQLSANPLMIKQMLNDFIAQFKEALENQKSDKMSETLKDLVEAMNNLSVKLEDTSLVQVQVNEQVMEAYEEIMDNKRQPQGNGQN